MTPSHYQLTPEPYECIKRWGLGFEKGNALKYISRAGRKNGASETEDLIKAIDYLIKRICIVNKIEDKPELLNLENWELSYEKFGVRKRVNLIESN